MSRFNSVPIMVQQLGEDINNPNTPHNVKFNKIVVLETIRDYCNTVLSVHGRETVRKSQPR
jgi:hypothetical protein